MSKEEILFGNEAITRSAHETGVEVSIAYPGIPSTEISKSSVQYDEIYAEWAPNEKVVTRVVIGVSIVGVCSMCVIEHASVNVVVDSLYTVTHIGVRGGLVPVMANNPGIYSPQDKQDSRMVIRAAMVPVVEPSDSAEAKEFMRYAYDLSEEYGTPVTPRSITRLSHFQGLVELRERAEPFDIPCEGDMAKYVMMSGNAIKHHVVVETRTKQMAKDANSFPINRVEYNDLSMGFITDGITHQYVKEAMPQASVLKLEFLNLLPRRLIEESASRVDKFYILEEPESVAGEQVRSWGIKRAVDKEISMAQGEYSANLIRECMLGQAPRADRAAQAPVGPPILCPGCPHRGVYAVLNKPKMYAIGDIDCCALGAVVPLSAIDTTTYMGASVNTLRGVEETEGRGYIKNWAAVIGGSIFIYTGINPLVNMVYSQAVGTVIILDSFITGVTRHQGHAATGRILKGQAIPVINIYDLCKSLDIEYVCEVDVFNQAGPERIVKEEVARDAAPIIIIKAPCAPLKGIKLSNECRPLLDRYEKCGACLRPGCPTLTKNEDGTISIGGTTCNGYRLCK